MILTILKFPIFNYFYKNIFLQNIFMYILIKKFNLNYYKFINSFIIKELYYNYIKFKTNITKKKSLIKKSGRKPWKQKGLGLARAGSVSSPNWKGGGIIFGPLIKKNLYKFNNKEILNIKNLFLYKKRSNILFIKINKVIILNVLFKNIFYHFNIFIYNNVLFVSYKYDSKIIKSFNNIKCIDLLIYKYIIFLI